MAVFENSRGTYELLRRGERPQSEFARRLSVSSATRITVELAENPAFARRVRNVLAQVWRRPPDGEPFDQTIERALASGAVSLHKRVPMVSPADFLTVVHAVVNPRAAEPEAVAERAANTIAARSDPPTSTPGIERAAAAQARALQQAAEAGTPLVHKCLDCPVCQAGASAA